MAHNAILRHQPLTVLQQIEELKNWHKQQQAKLNPGSISPQKSDSSQRSFETFQNKIVRNLVEKKKRDDPTPQESFDEVPIRVANPNFHNLIENNISPSEGHPDESHKNGEKPKFRFLKRGEGIARFRMGPLKIQKQANRNKRTLNLTNDTKKSDETDQNTTEKNHTEKDKKMIWNKGEIAEKEEIPALNPPDLKLDFKDWKGIFSSGKAEEFVERAIDNHRLELFQPNSSLDSSTASIMEKLLTIGRKHLREREELRVFETMEQHILDSSFCSTSSYVSKLMENAVISTPVKKIISNSNSLASNTQQSQPLYKPMEENAVQKNLERKPEPLKWTNPETTNSLDYKSKTATIEEDSEHSLHVRFAEEIDYKSFAEYSQSINNSNQKETSGGKRFDDSEEWKEYTGDDENSCCSQCSTSYSSSDEDARAISPPVKPPPSLRTHPTDHSGEAQHSKRRSPTDRLNVDDVRSEGTQSTEHTNSKHAMDMFPPVLGAKLKELEDEIEIFRAENNKVKALRESLEKEHKLLQQEKKKLFKEVEEEKKKNAALIEEEKQKLAKEKFIFEKYSKTLTKNPTKEERKEIQGLRDQLTEMKGELNKKESRWAAAQARVRNQVKLLENDNKKLKEEVETLRKQAKNLEFLTQRKKGKSYNNTKLIHAINDFISNVPVDIDKDVKESSEVGGYFNQNTNLVKTVVINESDPKSLNAIKVIKENVTENISSKLHSGKSAKLRESTRKESGEREQPLKDSNISPLGEQSSQGRETNHGSKNGEPSEGRHLYNLNSCENSQKAFDEECSQNSPREIINEDGNVEKIFSDGRKEIRYKNGNVKKIDPFTGNEKTIYFNSDVKEITRDGTLKYYFSESRIWQTTLPDGLVVLDFPNGQVEKRHTNGTIEVIYPNNNKKLTYRDGSEEIYYADGTVLKIEANKTKVLSLPNGQKEIHTDECIRREYPDGTVKICYPDGTTETVYSDGRVRLKDKHGNLVMDSGPAASSKL